MKLGLCLEGGGAKGSFQAGAIKGLYDGGIRCFDSISGTSIGAINGYFLFTDNLDKMEYMWKNYNEKVDGQVKIIDHTVDNSPMIEKLSGLYTEEKNLDLNFFVNYVKIDDRLPREVVVNLNAKEEKECLDIIKYSSLLPHNPTDANLDFRDQFIKDVLEGLYNGRKLDGGLANVRLLNPLIQAKVDKIILLTMLDDFKVPKAVKEIYNEDDIIAIGPDKKFGEDATLKFELDFLRENYKKGYNKGIEYSKKIKSL